jgi:hypothetical protein
MIRKIFANSSRILIRTRPLFIFSVAVLLIMPWFRTAFSWPEPVKRTGVVVGNAAPVKESRPGKWGELSLVPIVISPPTELVSTDLGEARRPTWFFPGVNAAKAAQMLRSAGVSAADADRLQSQARVESRITGVVLTPDPDWVLSLTPEIRARVYSMLAQYDLNIDQAQPFRYPGTSPDDWFNPSLISLQTRQLVEPLIYRDGEYMLFSDIQLVRAKIGSDEELRKLSKALFRQPTVIARLSVGPTANLDELVEYWGRGGRQTKVRPLIESVAGGGSDRFVDVIHLLPSFAQNHLYCYPELSDADLSKSALVNCLWTSLNFFQENPDDRFLDASVAIKTLKEDYFIVASDFKLGDIVAFCDEGGNIFHAAVYIADDLVFSKNGISSMAPWTLTTIDDVKGYYRWKSEKPRIVVHRRKRY